MTGTAGVLNIISKIKEMVIGFRRQENNPSALIITEKEVERAETFKYLGFALNNKLSWKSNTGVIVSKIKTRVCVV